MLHPGALTQKALKKNIFLSLFKFLGIHKHIVFHATDETEAGFIKDKFGVNVKIMVAGNYPGNIKYTGEKKKNNHRLHLISVGLISPMKNYWEVLNALQYVKFELQYDIVGPVKDPEYWSRCLQIIGQLPANVHVNILGELPSDLIYNYLKQADVFIMPSKSENFGHAHLEALNMGLPLVTSYHTPWNHLQAAHAGLNIETTPDAILEAILFFQKMNQTEYSQWSFSARTYAASQIDFDSLNQQYQILFKSVKDKNLL
jgi:glycosyltransferase involved in cell wall biosynthesis